MTEQTRVFRFLYTLRTELIAYVVTLLAVNALLLQLSLLVRRPFAVISSPRVVVLLHRSK